MDTLAYLAHGFEIALQPQNLLIALIGAFIGTIVGLLPGLGPINGVALLLPFAFALGLPPESALILLAAVYLGCEYGGRISAILINVPGDAAAIMSTLDGYPLAKQGKAGIALSLSAASSFIGSMVATIGIVLFAPLLAKWAIVFGPAEYFVLMVFALTCLSGLISDQPVKTGVSALIGLGLATVGVDAVTGVYRFTFDSVNLSDGIQFTTIVIGFFSISEILIMLEQTTMGQKALSQGKRTLFNFKEFMFSLASIIRSSFLGFIVGILPGAGATIASAMAYTSERKLAGKDSKFGEGDLRGIAAPEAANNASACGSFVPMLTLGVPGSGTTAVMLGALTLYNITPGPQLFTEQPTIVWGLIASLFIGNVILLVMNIPLVGFFAKLLTIPNYILIPAIATVSFVGVYAIHSTVFDLVLMVVLGIFGYFLRKMNFPLSALILGFVLGELMESSLRRALSISHGDLSILFNGSITKVLWILAGLMIVLPLFRYFRNRRNATSA
ncbi:tripartite tricarboxylate transporter permease [Acinetobacter faecalis]|uniref:Tripartite tricarboxylate transporter permease n=4 Tax=Acinetobacter faecalis TaxID=2665161 RepID=A0AB35UWR1_9GAMM|nr:tripartite tricarboxylate transporter permease [Acinetobacter faecalis]MDY6456965.1 tripartite tricarboxylate transporter permease [Acinetobacter faecalis]MDY6459192.1 tripartite tricarboxylate transporter permease [Acinetobacter faecalis]MDY6486883.1 tripartite tricarboxylate transporter permease [Acinetobacter faecalis]MDY6488371.1 tripartite tricarboxylate transporter permease [Acinetobacter faecalis]MDY6523486.1 tripartite tricarboxylate transporter permease [Acinetobacter faecalis]